MPRPIHFEITADDPERAARFYREAFGWNLHKWDGPMEYWLITTGEGEPGIDGGMGPRGNGDPAATVNTIGVESLDEAVAAIERAGGTIIRPKGPIPGVGWLAYAKDTEGNEFGVMQPDENAA
jgi:predicted enzyme related to lactoylglutathione lyase